MKSFDEIKSAVKKRKIKTVVVVKAEDKEILKAAIEAHREKITDFILVGDKNNINSIADENKYNIGSLSIEDEPDEKKALLKSLALIRSGKGHILMKGKISTSTLLKGVLNKETGLREKRILSHCLVAKTSKYKKLIIVTDGGMNLNPDLKMKIDIVNNSLELARKLGIEKPKVAGISAVETVNPDLPETIDGAVLSKMSQRGQIKNCIIDGPVAIDLALSSESASIKGIKTPIGGDADIFLVPNITVGNVLGKSLIYLAESEVGGIIVGAKAPVVMLSRSDSAEVRLNSIALGALMIKN